MLTPKERERISKQFLRQSEIFGRLADTLKGKSKVTLKQENTIVLCKGMADICRGLGEIVKEEKTRD